MFNGKAQYQDKWSGEVVASFADEFIRKHKEEPFLAYVSFMAPHAPWQAPESYIEPYLSAGHSKKASTLFGMIEYLDYCVGKVLNSLKETGLEDNTIVVFMSDNGPWTSSYNFGKLSENEWAIRNPVAYKGNKGTNWENGIKSPLFIRFGEKSQHVKSLITIEDICPTLLELCGIDVPKDVEGVSFKEALLEKPYKRDKPFFISQWNPEYPLEMRNEYDQWGHHLQISDSLKGLINLDSQRVAVRSGAYKLLFNQYGGAAINQRSLYNITEDPLET